MCTHAVHILGGVYINLWVCIHSPMHTPMPKYIYSWRLGRGGREEKLEQRHTHHSLWGSMALLSFYLESQI